MHILSFGSEEERPPFLYPSLPPLEEKNASSSVSTGQSSARGASGAKQDAASLNIGGLDEPAKNNYKTLQTSVSQP